MAARVVRVYDDGWRIGIAADPGRKFTSVVVMDSAGLSVTKLPNTDRAALQPVDYPLTKAVKKFRAAGRTFGMTQGAKALLDTAIA